MVDAGLPGRRRCARLRPRSAPAHQAADRRRPAGGHGDSCQRGRRTRRQAPGRVLPVPDGARGPRGGPEWRGGDPTASGGSLRVGRQGCVVGGAAVSRRGGVRGGTRRSRGMEVGASDRRGPCRDHVAALGEGEGYERGGAYDAGGIPRGPAGGAGRIVARAGERPRGDHAGARGLRGRVPPLDRRNPRRRARGDPHEDARRSRRESRALPDSLPTHAGRRSRAGTGRQRVAGIRAGQRRDGQAGALRGEGRAQGGADLAALPAGIHAAGRAWAGPAQSQGPRLPGPALVPDRGAARPKPTSP